MAEDGLWDPKWLYNPLGFISDEIARQPANPTDNTTAPGGMRANATDYNRVNEAINTAFTSGKISEAEYTSLTQRLNNHWTEGDGSLAFILEGELGQTIQNNESRTTTDADRARYEAGLTEGRANLDRYEQEIGGQIQGDISRYQGILSSGGGLKTDAEYSKIMREAEDTLATQLQTVHANAAKSMSDAGLRSAGKGGGNAAYIADQQAFQGKANVATGLMADARTRLTDAQQRNQQFQGGVMDARNQLNSGYLPSITSLGQYKSGIGTMNPFQSYATGLDVSSLGIGQRLGRQALNQQETLGILGIGANLASSGMQSGTQLLGMIRPGG